ncbi:DUF4395 domain-containing protein [Mycobacterium sp. CBMA293]|nr:MULTISPECIES: DUF4395 domain-containing protein [unclassified Mycolicibacterium]MUL61820.1 DUF4395 domain-containing protein [Mycolicibacterium sp. CBMA 335]MUL70884.1 DUF4395 domain-containing protein [Mycolicibacterium sp. CBMA 311]MUM08668.1 hypothetical protein [Mycolicibacterium sp. CBMA 213]MUM14354.1 DUF4395 domain-containing protein [Mycolicibacterium sp. CBMA 293]MUL47662.1 DUF4395 domain-containing protein [Mycolicibacterium sp. CBMA 360]
MSNNSIETPQVDVRGPRFAAWLTTGVLIAALLTSAASPTAASPTAAALILGVQAVIFAIGAVGGPRRHPYGRIFATFIAPRLTPVTEKEPVAPLKFAQLVGLLFAIAGTVGFAAGITALGLTATAFALVAAFLNAAFGICLGCQIYPLVARLRRSAIPAT